MLALGLLWFDDDSRRPLAQKIAEAIARYEERVGEAPSVCQVSPAQAAALASARPGQIPRVRIVSDETLRPNHFLVGIEQGEELPDPLRQIELPVAEVVSAAPVRAKTKRRQPTEIPVTRERPSLAAAHTRHKARPREESATAKSRLQASGSTAAAELRTPRGGRQATERVRAQAAPPRRRAS
jgi:hypothetical protein